METGFSNCTASSRLRATAAILILINLLWTGGLAVSHDKALNDRLSYYLVARTLATGGGLATPAQSIVRSPDRTPPYAVGERPLYPFLVSLLFRMVGPSVQAANFVAAMMRSLTLLPLLALALCLFDQRVALVAGVMYTFSPPWTGLGATAMSDTTFAFFVYLGLWLFVLYWRGSPWAILWSGASLALATLTREEGLFLIVFLSLALLLHRRWQDLGRLLVVPVLSLGAWQLYLSRTFGSLPYTARPLFLLPHYELFLLLRTPTLPEYLAAVGGWSGAIYVRLYNYVGYARNLLADGLLLDTAHAGLFPFTFLIPLGIAIWQQIRARQTGSSRRQVALLLTMAMVFQFLMTLGYVGYPQAMAGEIRHIQVITPYLLILAATGICWLWDRSRLGKGFVTLLAIHFTLFCLIYQALLVHALVIQPSYNSADIQALRQLAPTLDEDAVLMSRKPNRAAYYSGRPSAIMPLAGFRDLMAYAQAAKATHLVVQRRELRTRPGLAEGLTRFSSSLPLVLERDGTQIFAVRDYDFLDRIPTGSALDQQVDPAAPITLPGWETLIRRSRPSTLSLLWQTLSPRQEGGQ